MTDPRAYIREIGKQIGEEFVNCDRCNLLATHCGDVSPKTGYGPDECLEFQCTASCKSRGWAYCLLCERRFGRSNVIEHAKTRTHKKRKAERDAKKGNQKRKASTDEHTEMESDAVLLIREAEAEAVDVVINDDFHGEGKSEDSINIPLNENFVICPGGAPDPDFNPQQYPPIDYTRNEWMIRLFADTPRATWTEVRECFADMREMKDYWTAEHATTPGFCGGGIRLLIAKTFQNTDDGAGLAAGETPGYIESRWHFDYFMQYTSMDDKQRQRQARITKTIMDHVSQQKGGFFQHTFIPEYKDLSKMYGKTGRNSIWNNLPIPPMELVNGVAYVSPINIIKFLFANGVAIDDMFFNVDKYSEDTDFDTDNNKHSYIKHVSQCQRTRKWMQQCYENAKKNDLTTGKYILLWSCDWKDGFGPSRVKNNRGSVDAMTITLAPPKDLVNGIENTFLVAVGLKRSKDGWDEVAHRFNDDIRKLSEQAKPILFYHGTLQKMVPVCFKRYVSITDKIERPASTGTIGCGSDIHKCYGTLGCIVTPKCDSEAIAKFIADELDHLHISQWGWCDQFIRTDEGRNGAILPSCRKCRLRRIRTILKGHHAESDSDAPTTCQDCADWTQNDPSAPPTLLQFPTQRDYPRAGVDDCPIAPPKGREPGLTHLSQIELTFEHMIQASKYAFYHYSNRAWGKGNVRVYLGTCGVSPQIVEEILEAAFEARDMDIDYNNKERIGALRFPAPWVGDLSISDYIETIMHLLHLGIAKSLFEIVLKWLKDDKVKGLSGTAFLRAIQPLLLELKKFQLLGWLPVWPFNGKEDDYTTGSWVSENWMAFVRISPILFGWCCRDLDTGIKNGFRDVARTILSFHAVCARVMTHGGIDPGMIDETEYLMREFMSCIRELDIRVRHESMKTNRASAFWDKSNFMSLLNLIDMMLTLGPLILWWDGGGKGEKFIQEIKPHIRRGVREDYHNFFLELARKMYRVRQISYTEKRLGLQPHVEFEDEMNAVSLDDLVAEAAIEVSDDEEDEDEDEDEDSNLKGRRQGEVTDAEDDAMFKGRTIYIYRNEAVMNESVDARKPIAGILQSVSKAGDEKAFEFRTVFRKPVKQFAERVLNFNDAEGLSLHGMWYSPVNLDEEHIQITGALHQVQEDAKMAAVAIPLHYILGEEHPDGDKYCVITNWWKVRIKSGNYVLPGLDASMYAGFENDEDDDLPPHVEVRHGDEFMQI